ISAYHHLLGAEAFAASHRPDLVVRFGRLAQSRPLLTFLTPDVPQILVDPDAMWLDPTRALAEIAVGDASASAAALGGHLPGREPSTWLASWREAEERARAAIDDLLDGLATPNEPRAARDAALAVPDGGTLVVGSSMPVRDVDAYLPRRDGLRVTGNRGASGIDGTVSTALGVALGSAAPTVALVGDLALLHDSNGFLLLDEGVDLPIVVVNNDGGGIFSFLPQADFPASFERLFGTPHGRDLGRLAVFHGLDREVVDRPDRLRPAIDAALHDGGIRLIEVRTDRGENVALHRRLQEAVTAAVS
ncbi:MAG: thiamine pyrophosphate-dependent enzyme, partial [Nitriliruptorales bacterium]